MPGRAGVEQWRPKAGCMDAELWLETIPFLETRRYVRKLLFYAAVYEWRVGRPVTTVTARLGKIPARPQGRTPTRLHREELARRPEGVVPMTSP